MEDMGRALAVLMHWMEQRRRERQLKDQKHLYQLRRLWYARHSIYAPESTHFRPPLPGGKGANDPIRHSITSVQRALGRYASDNLGGFVARPMRPGALRSFGPGY